MQHSKPLLTHILVKLAGLALLSATLSFATSSVTLLTGPTARLVANEDDCSSEGPVGSIQVESSDPETGDRKTTAKCLFNRNRDIVESLHYLDMGSYGTNIQRTVTVYDREGRPIESDIYDVTEDPDHPYRYVLTLDSQGRSIEGTTFDPDGAVSNRVVSEYDSFGDLVKETSYSSTGEVSGTTVREYDANHHLLFWQEGTAEPKRYRYNDKGQLTEETFGAAKNSTRSFYTYDEQGRVRSIETVTAKTLQHEENDNFCDDCTGVLGKIIYKYNAHGLLTEEQVIQPNGRMVRLSRYAYDNWDNHTRKWVYFAAHRSESAGKITVEVDGKPQVFAKTNGLPETTYSYDRQGNWIKAVETTVSDDDLGAPREVNAVTYRTIQYY